MDVRKQGVGGFGQQLGNSVHDIYSSFARRARLPLVWTRGGLMPFLGRIDLVWFWD
jgi:hypothetical protein